MESRRVLITGASGFVGAHLVAGFRAAGWSVFAGMRRESDPWRMNILMGKALNVDTIELDFRNPEGFSAALGYVRPQVVINGAAYGVDSAHHDFSHAVVCNVQGPTLLMEAASAARVEYFIHLGTGYEYGEHPGPITEDAALRPSGLYAASKAAGSILALECAGALGSRLVLLRPFGLYGLLEGPHKLFPQLIRACRDGERVEFTPGDQVRDYIHVTDLVRVCLMAVENPQLPPVARFNIGSGTGCSLRQLGTRIAAIVGRRKGGLAWGARPYRQGEINSLVADPQAANVQLGWRPRVSLEEGIRGMLVCPEPARAQA